MPTFARLVSGFVAEIVDLPNGVTVDAAFHPDVAKTMVACDSDVAVGWTHAKGAFSAPPPALPSKAELIAYVAAKQVAIANGGIKVNVGAAKSPVYVTCRTNADGRSLLETAAFIVTADPTATTAWVSDGQVVKLNAQQVGTIKVAVASLIQGSFATRGAITTAINAGTITTFDQIDNPASSILAWPSNS